MKTVSFILLFFLTTIDKVFSQNNNQSDTTLNPLKPTINYSSFNLLISAGIQKSLYFDIGVSWERFAGSGHGYTDIVPLASFSIFPSFNKNIPTVYGVKAGIELGGSFQMLCLEMGYFWNRNSEDFLIIPKYCIGAGVFNAFYGYGFSTNNKSISRIGGHTFGLQSNIPFLIKDKMKNQRKYFLTF